jgi:hypothetical protein
MTRKQYRTAQGKIVDLGAIQLQNEHVRAVGNMNVNARGDTIDSKGNTIDSRNRQLNRQYNRQVAAPVSDTPLPSSRRAARQQAEADTVESTPQTRPDTVESTPQTRPDPAPAAVTVNAVEPTPVQETTATEGGGLAAAIAKARSIKQEPLKTLKQQAQETPGVRKI